MNKASQLPRHVATAHSSSQVQLKGLNRPTAFPRQAAGESPSSAASKTGRAPVAPPVYRPQPPAPKAVQPKMQTPAAAAPSRPATPTPSGVIQANIIGGTPALRAHLAAWHERAQPSAVNSQTPAPRNVGANLKAAPGQNDRPQAIQPKSRTGVEAFNVPLRPKSGGHPIPDQVRAKMEAAFGADFSDVRVHVGREASSIGAIAYTWGTNIHFAPGQYNPFSIQGQKLLGHELWHVVQQKSGRVRNPLGGGVAVVQDHALEAEADRMGIKAALTPTPRPNGK